MEGLVECIETASTSQTLAISFALCIMTSFDDFETPGGGGEGEEGAGGEDKEEEEEEEEEEDEDEED